MSHVRRMTGVGVATICAVSGCIGGDDGENGGRLIRAGLNQIPADTYELASDATDSFELAIGDVAAAAKFIGVAEPEKGRDEAEITPWLGTLTMFGTSNGNGTGLALPLPRALDLVMAPPDLVKDELGIDLGAITTYAAVEAPIGQFVVFGGDMELDSSLDDMGDGVVGFGTGDDLQANLEESSALSRLGRPLRLGQNDDGVAVSYSTESIEAYLAQDKTLGDDRRFVAVADALDAADSIGAYIVERDFSSGALGNVATREAPSDLVADAQVESDSALGYFDIVGVGMFDSDGEAANVVVYHFDTEEDAASAVEALDDVWRNADLFAIGAPVRDVVDVVSVAADESTVTVTLDLLMQREVMFLHD
jgi:hypothetical protein